ncbi:MAG: DUF6282 family protein [Gammaproteobacteria bacterium]
MNDQGAGFVAGAIDLYVHAEPDLIPRHCDDVELAGRLAAAGYAAAVHRNHFSPTAERARLAARATGFDMHGAILVHDFAGGMNPGVVELALRMGAVWVGMPTLGARRFRGRLTAMPEDIRTVLGRGRAVDVVDENGRLLPAVHTVLDLAREHRAVVATGYLQKTELAAVVRAAVEHGVERIVLSNPLSAAMGLTPAEVGEIMTMGEVVLEQSVYQHLPGPNPAAATLADCAALVRSVGVARAVLSSDGGIATAAPPQVLLAQGCAAFLDAGFDATDVRRLVRDNPAALIGR